MPRMIAVYTTSHRTKARQELKRHGIKPYTPPEFGGLIAANDKPPEATYVHGKIGTVSRDEFARMYARTSKTQRRHKFAVGTKVNILKGYHAEVPAVVLEILGRGWYVLGVEMMGKLCPFKKHERDLEDPRQIRYEPG